MSQDGTTVRHQHLADLDAHWIVDSNGRHVGVRFQCPTCPQDEGATMLAVLFGNPPDGGFTPPRACGLVGDNNGKRWSLVGEGTNLETLTLHPSVDCSQCGHWHGFVRHGDVT